MARRKTTRHRPTSRSQVLEMRVVTPKIVWFQTLSVLGGLFKWCLLCACCGGIGYGVWTYLKNSYIDNPNYQLRIVKLTPNTVMNEADVVEIGQIPLNTSIFGVDVAAVEERLLARPEVVSAVVRREFPATISIEITERVPFAWIECAAKNMDARTRERGFLIDRQARLYPCPPMQYEASVALPVIEVAAEDADSLVVGAVVETKAMRRSIQLLEIAEKAGASKLPWIDRIQPYTVWGMKVWTRDGIEAVFGLEEHERQMEDLLVAMRHAATKGMQIASINLIPERNFPVTLRAPGSNAPLRVRPQSPPHSGSNFR